jgi:hypothetical protein
MGLLSSCVVSPLTKKPVAKAWQRASSEAPHLLVRAFYGKPEIAEAMMRELEDVARPVRRWARQGNGAVSVRFVNERGRALRVAECGGQLIVEGQPGQAYALKVRNETDVTIEVLPMVDGLDLETGEAADLARAGRRVAPRKETVFAVRAGADGKGEALRFREVNGPEALRRTAPTGTLGSVVVAVFLGEGTDSFDDRPALQRRRPGTFPQPGSFPQRRYEPMLLPYQYR